MSVTHQGCKSFTPHVAMQEKESEMDQMYSRGIDPILADPSKCHSHPDAPPEWPPQHQVQAYAQKVLQSWLILLIHLLVPPPPQPPHLQLQAPRLCPPPYTLASLLLLILYMLSEA